MSPGPDAAPAVPADPGFGARLADRMRRLGPLCVGIDPDAATLAGWGLPDSADGARAFGLAMVQASAGIAAAVKPQVAFFERFGAAGFAALEEILAALRQAELLSIADAKRGDIGSTMAGYAAAWLDPQSPLAADAVTLNPYLGPASLAPAVDLLGRHGRGAFLLAATSNPEAAALQLAGADSAHADSGRAGLAGSPLGQVLDYVAHANRDHRVPGDTQATDDTWNPGDARSGSVGVVFGATMGGLVPQLHRPLESLNGPVLVPGYGAQGATAAALHREFGPAYPHLLINSSRAIARTGPDTARVRAAIIQAAEELATH